MNLKSLIKRSVDTTFRIAGDLKENFTFLDSNSESFDFSTGLVDSAVSLGSTSFEAIVHDYTEASDDVATIRKRVVAKTEDVVNLSFYDEVRHDSQDWVIGKVLEKDPYITQFEIYRMVRSG
jgi:hypothetical protein